jgi:hypothetical protein
MSILNNDRKLRFTPEEQMQGAEQMAETLRKGGKEVLREVRNRIVHPGQEQDRRDKRPRK